ncbi:MAG TPA: N-acetyl-1-D-myo-inositol-2-amino-2-deoxy-alpha-D-glucopyranoside deacetylase [Streptosporangiaceae bacterium]|nr:N-acetyl-1-D-myo-inositol-2-amino-2-deoxy-alpha-D-glucopyranoside deacetylase [Streptosporangiaceae bacterium]
MPDHTTGRRLLLVHAHPDDESIGTGATMAKYAAEGAHVTLVTCTLGELGEIIPPQLSDLAAEKTDRLGEYRIGELAAACKALGVTDHRFLGGAGRWRDSGMMGLASNDDPRCFWQADVDDAARTLAAIINEVRPQVMVSYDQNGLYGHPDHIQAHRVARRAFRLSASLPSPVAKFFATAVPRSSLPEAFAQSSADAAALAAAGFNRIGSRADVPYGTPDDQVTTRIDGAPYLSAKTAAMRAHATQIAVSGAYFALSNGIGQRIMAREHYTLLAGQRGAAGAGGAAGASAVGAAGPRGAAGAGAAAGPGGFEDDLFAGLP